MNSTVSFLAPLTAPLTLLRADWPAPDHVQAYVTTAQANMALHVGDDPQQVLQNRAQLMNQLGVKSIAWLEQKHTTHVVRAADWQQPPVADALWTDEIDRAIAVMTADCLPVFFTDIKGEKVAVAHAGWRGLLNGVLENTVAAMNILPDQLIAWLGPAVSQVAFEVGEEVRAAFIKQNAFAQAAFIPSNRADHWLADLYQLARLRLANLGLTACYGGHYCTYNQADLFYSYRRSAHTGRMASVIFLNNIPFPNNL